MLDDVLFESVPRVVIVSNTLAMHANGDDPFQTLDSANRSIPAHFSDCKQVPLLSYQVVPTLQLQMVVNPEFQ